MIHSILSSCVFFPLLFLGKANLVTHVKHERSYNDIDFFEYETLNALTKDLFNEEGRIATTNVLLGIADTQCLDQLKNPSFRGIQRHAGGKTVVSASLPLREAPFPITKQRKRSQCAELYFYPKGFSLSRLPIAIYDKEFDYQQLQDWEKKLMRKDIRFYNDFDYPLDVYWNDEAVSSVHVGTVRPGAFLYQNSFIGHLFSARKIPPSGQPSSDDLTVDFAVVHGSIHRFSPQNRLQTCDFLSSGDKDLNSIDEAQTHFDYEDQMIKKAIPCDDMSLRLEKYKLEVLHSKRLGLNYLQPTHIPGFTPMGFEKRRLPAETFHWLRTWYDKVKEEGKINMTESSAGPCMNQVDAPSVMHMITSSLKTRLARELQPLLEEWYGAGKLKMTSIYGVRKYTDGSILRMHVDTANTHVISAIINVDQEVDEPWRLLILDHDENEHWITMAPGDMVLYESAKMLHGRPEPMKGERYENIFLHYMPAEGWEYY